MCRRGAAASHRASGLVAPDVPAMSRPGAVVTTASLGNGFPGNGFPGNGFSGNGFSGNGFSSDEEETVGRYGAHARAMASRRPAVGPVAAGLSTSGGVPVPAGAA